MCLLQLVEEKKKVVAEWVSVEDAQREYDAKRDEYVGDEELHVGCGILALHFNLVFVKV